jgi:hypothetical protein
MHRIDIDEAEFNAIYDELSDKDEATGAIATVIGSHEEFGNTILIRSSGSYVVFVDQVTNVRLRRIPVPVGDTPGESDITTTEGQTL